MSIKTPEFPCQVADPDAMLQLPCKATEGGGFQCERLDSHFTEHELSEHTMEHAYYGNLYECRSIGWH